MSRNTKGLATQLPYHQTSAPELLIAIPGVKPQVSLLYSHNCIRQ